MKRSISTLIFASLILSQGAMANSLTKKGVQTSTDKETERPLKRVQDDENHRADKIRNPARQQQRMEESTKVKPITDPGFIDRIED